MRGLRKSTGLVMAIVLAVAVVVVGSDRASGQGDVHVLIPVGTGRTSFIDVVRGPGLQIGDGLAARGPLVDTQGGGPAGSVYFECTVMRRIGLEEGLWRCSYHLRLADGAIVLQGLDPRGMGSSTFAVVGGTKAYRGASGDAVFTDSTEGTDIVITLT
jgi:hypothetical protein